MHDEISNLLFINNYDNHLIYRTSDMLLEMHDVKVKSSNEYCS